MQVTVCGKIKDTSLYPVLDATSHLMDKVERLYFRERYIKHADRNGLKRLFLKEYGITGKQLNGVIFNLSGNVEANRQALFRNLETKKRKLDKVGKRIKSALKSDRKERNRRKHVWSDWRVVSRILERDRKSRSGSRQASDSARGIPLSIAAGPSPAMDGSLGSRGNPSGGSQQHCSAGVCGCSTIFEPF